jgi:phosphatidylglycerol---prolipoprotein diacylglyceryl transferase
LYPTLYQVSDGFGIHTYGLMIMLALLAAFVVSSQRARQVGIDSDDLPLMYLLVAAAGIFVSRLFYFLFSVPEKFFADPTIFFSASEGGLVFYGGPIGGVLVGVAYCMAKKIPVLKMVDIGAPAIMLGLAVGRIGCFFAGCCHGSITGRDVSSTLLSLPGGEVVLVDGGPVLALLFHKGVGVGSIHGLPLYPTQIWEGIGAFLLFLSLSWIWKKLRYFDGQILVVMMIFYAGLRSSIENFRGDSIRGEDIVAGLSSSQSISVVMVGIALLFGLVRIAYARLKGEALFEPEIPFVHDERLDEELL